MKRITFNYFTLINYLFFYPFYKFLYYGRVFYKHYNTIILAVTLLYNHYFHLFFYPLTHQGFFTLIYFLYPVQ